MIPGTSCLTIFDAIEPERTSSEAMPPIVSLNLLPFATVALSRR
jgi:hypothetical protein